MSICKYCGAEVPEDAGFCGICGQPFANSRQKARGNNGYPAVSESVPGALPGASSPSSQRRTIRRPYQYSPPSSQQYQEQQQSSEPTVGYTQRPQGQPVAAPVQQAPYIAPAAVRPSAAQYPQYPNRQQPIFVGNPTPAPGRGPGSPRRPRKRRGCLISLVVVLLLLVIACGVGIPTVQKVLAFGSAISAQAPLSSQTGYMGTSDRVNILMLGYGGSGHNGAYLTDSMVVMSLLPQSHHTTLVSVPRDLWVQYPPNSGNYTKINAVYPIASNGNANRVAGGDAIAQKVSLVTGLDVKYWMTINFAGFREFIDAIGGVDVDVPDAFTANYPKNDDPNINASWIKIHFSPGLQHMDGTKAIQYARARYVLDNPAEGTDFARSARQQIIMKAALSKLKDWHTWPSFFKAMDALQHTIYSNLSLADLAMFALKMDLNNAHRVGLSFSNVLMGQLIDGQDVLLPKNGNWQSIKDYINQQLYN